MVEVTGLEPAASSATPPFAVTEARGKKKEGDFCSIL